MAGRGKEEEGYSVEAHENMGVALEQFKESLIPIGSEEANKNVFATIKIMIKGVRRRLVDLGNVDAPEGEWFGEKYFYTPEDGYTLNEYWVDPRSIDNT